MPTFGWKQEFRDSIADASVVETFDRLGARLNGFLGAYGANNAEEDLEKGVDPPPGPNVQDILAPFRLPVARISLTSDALVLRPDVPLTEPPTPAGIVRLVPLLADRAVSGMSGFSDGRIVEIFVPRSAAFRITLKHADANATANTRLDLVGAADLSSVVGEPRSWRFWYDTTDNIWQMLGGSAALAAAVFKNLVETTTQVQTAADTTETTFWEASLPANTFAKTGDTVHIRAFGDFKADISGKKLSFYFDGVQMATTNAQQYNDRGWQLHVVIMRQAEDVQIIHANFVPAVGGASGAPLGNFVTDAATESGAIVFKITGTNSVALNGEGDITFEGGHAFKVGAA